ncbi:mannitol dehydrogenase family protein [Microbacterium sp. NPDC096154]|uniref:mannitol dehydrogenase family protein n=1 Tax=Microbacterium sp. NPDC096154 TaxID=3155549 RepID=UPI003327A95E
MSLVLDDTAVDRLDAFEAAGFGIPRYDVRAMRAATAERPAWVHFGAGNFFRSLHAVVAQQLLDAGHDTGIVLANLRDAAVVENSRATDDLFVNAVMREDGSLEPTVIASVAESHHLAPESDEGWARLTAVFENPSLQLVTLTVTEKGYATAPDDLVQGPGQVRGAIPALASLLLARFAAGAAPVALVSTDNFSDNGDRLASALRGVAEVWIAAGQAPPEFGVYLAGPSVAYPSTMVDRITPAPSAAVGEALAALGLQGTELHERGSGGPLAAFSNTEAVSYLVLEDAFPNGRPPFERSSVVLGDRETVARADRMKVCTCLNPLHTAMAVTGCLLGFTRIADMMQDADIRRLVVGVGAVEGLPVVDTPAGMDPKAFLREVIERRLPNPGLPDAPQRIAADTSQKVGIRFGETIRRHVAAGSAQSLTWIPFAIAAWIRYLLAIDDRGEPFERSPDPLLEQLDERLAPASGRGVRFGEPRTATAARELLADASIFGVDLVAAGVAPTVIAHLSTLLHGPGAVRAALYALAHS